MQLFRPVGLYELRLIAESDWRAFPPRLPEQPIFYPVLNQGYAEEIAGKWNPEDPNSGFAGIVTVFDVRDEVAGRYPRKVVGGKQHEELWVPAKEQQLLEAAFTTPIRPIVAFVGSRVREVLPSYAGPQGRIDDGALGRLVEAVEQGPVVGGPLTEGRQGSSS